MNTNNYSLLFSSPYSSLFNSDRIKQNPPIHVEIINETSQRGENLKNIKSEEMAKCMKKM